MKSPAAFAVFSARLGSRLSLSVLLGLPFSLSLTACHAPPPAQPVQRVVLTQVVGEADGDSSSTYSGEVRSRTEIPLSFRIPGKLMARLVDAGAEVKAGQVLARLEPSDMQAQAAAARAQADLATAELRRYQELQQKNFVSQAALDSKISAAKSAQAQATLAGNQSAYTVLHAEQSGVIAQVQAEAGQVLAAGQPVFQLSRPDQAEVWIAVPETQVAKLQTNMPAQVQLWAEAGAATAKTYQGRIRELSKVADALTHTYTAKISVLDAAANSSNLRLGMSAKVKFATQNSQLKIPLSAIFQQQNQPAVWVVSAQNQVSLRPVEVAAWQTDGAVLQAGLTAGERIVTAGVHKLAAGETIKLAEGK